MSETMTPKGTPKGVDEKKSSPESGKRIIVLSVVGGRAFRLDKERVVIGSVVSADVRIAGPGVAPIHAIIEGPSFPVIYDLASETGVYVNGQKVVTHSLQEGDKIAIGSFSLVFQTEDLKALPPKERFRESEGRKLFMNPAEDFTPLLLEDEREVEQIFDYRPAQRQALEVVMSWNDTIMDVEHFVQRKPVVIGSTRSCHFVIPALLTAKKHTLAEHSGAGYVLNLDPKISGVMQSKGEIKDISSLKSMSGSGQISLEENDFAKLSIGDLSFYISFTAAPPRLKPNKMFERDPLFLKIFFSSLLLTGLTIVALLNASVPPNLEAEQIPERIATIIYEMEKFERPKITVPIQKPVQKVEQQVAKPKPEPMPKKTVKLDIKPNAKNLDKPVPKKIEVKPVAQAKPAAQQGQNEAKEGAGARAKGTEGVRGTKTAKSTVPPQNKATRPSPSGGAGAGGGRSQVEDIGNVDLVKGTVGKIQDILGSSASRLGKGGEQIKGFGGFDSRGGGGLALSGTGTGGGGASNLSSGLSDQGRGGGKVGTGLGAAGSGTGIIGGLTRVPIRTGGEEDAIVMGTIDADAVEAALLAHRDEFRLCYERELNAENPRLAGRVGTSFVIGSSGHVTQAGIESTSLKNRNTEACILKVIRRIKFPLPRGAGIVQVTYPFKFASR